MNRKPLVKAFLASLVVLAFAAVSFGQTPAKIKIPKEK